MKNTDLEKAGVSGFNAEKEDMDEEKKNNLIQLKKLKSKCPTCKKNQKNLLVHFVQKNVLNWI